MMKNDGDSACAWTENGAPCVPLVSTTSTVPESAVGVKRLPIFHYQSWRLGAAAILLIAGTTLSAVAQSSPEEISNRWTLWKAGTRNSH